MRVLLIDVNCNSGSTGKIVYDLYQGLRADGHEAAICYGRGKLVKGENIFKFGLDWETYIHAGLARITGLNGYFSPFSTRRLIHFIEEFKPDVVHIHELHAYFVNHQPLLNYLKRKKIKIIWTFHCEYMYTGKCGHAFDCDKWKTECKNCTAVHSYPKSLFFDFTKTMFREKKKLLEDMDVTVIAPSDWLAKRIEMSFLKNKKIVVIHNGVEAKKIFYPREQKDIIKLKKNYGLSNKKIVLSVAPNIMNDSKGGKKILEISKSFIGKPVHFVLVGTNENKTIGDNVTLIKRTSNQDELALWYSSADVFLICSTKETFSMTCAEAIACGTSVIGFKAGAPETVFQQPCAHFFEWSDINSLLDAIWKQEKTPNTIQVLRNEALKLYDNDIMYKSYIKVYNA